MKRECKHPCCGETCRKKKPKKIRKPIKPVSRKREKLNREYSKERKQFLEENPVCVYPNCGKESTDVHHSKGRGKYFIDVSTWKALCRNHHDEIELKPLLGKQLGLSESRLTDPLKQQ